jgi:hypothetical protein
VVITGLLFEDGTIEGDAAGVWLAPLTYLGRRAQLHLVVELFSRTSMAGRPPTEVIQSLSSAVESLPVVVDPRLGQAAADLLPPSGQIISPQAIDGTLSAALAEVRRGVLSDLQSAPHEPEAFGRWLTEIREQYRAGHQRFVALTSRATP